MKNKKYAIWVERICENCHIKFNIKESSLKYGRGKCCSRKCVDENKQKTYLGENNGMYGKKENEEHKKIRGQKIKEGTTKESIKKRKESIKLFVKHNGYYPGTDEKAKQKRKNTLLEKYGVDHCWKVKEIRKKCDEACYKLYGKYSWELFIKSSLYGHDTFIEKIIHNILKKYNIEFITQFRIPYKNTYKEYDICIPSLKILIEADGDFWHANPKIFDDENKLYEIQKTNRDNDNVKNELAKNENLHLIRYWESDIKENEFENKLIEELKKYGYDKN